MLVFSFERYGSKGNDGPGTVASKCGHDGFFFFVGVDSARGFEIFGERSIRIDGGTCYNISIKSLIMGWVYLRCCLAWFFFWYCASSMS